MIIGARPLADLSPARYTQGLRGFRGLRKVQVAALLWKGRSHIML